MQTECSTDFDLFGPVEGQRVDIPMKDSSDFGNNPIMTARIHQIEGELHQWAAKPVELTFDASATDLFSMMELAHSYAKRSAAFADAIRRLLAKEMIVPAVVVGRALIETVAMGCLYLHDMRRLTEAGDHVALDKRFSKYFIGQKGKDIGPVHQ
jgi:hypothetical protein